MGARSHSDTDTFESEQELYNVVERRFAIGSINRLYVCSLCDFNATGPLTIVDHIRSHSREAPWDCLRCANELNGDEDGDEPHDPSCLDRLEGEGGEILECQEDLERSKSQEEHKCTLCPYKSTFLSEVVEHIRLHMRKRRAKDPLDIDDLIPKSWDNVYTCTECEFSCIRPDKLEKHMKNHAPNAKFNCLVCQYEAETRKELQQHKRQVHGFLKPFQCDLCSAKFTRMDNLKTHINNHSGQRRYPCKQCGYASPNKARLIAHYNSHKVGKPRIRGMANCPVCNRSYTNYPLLITHLKTHVVSPPYLCMPCGFQFEAEEELFAHQTDHVDGHAFSCAFCDFKCFDESTIHNHLGVVHSSEKPFECDICHYRFSSIVHWRRHQLVHTGEKPFSCDLCHAKFSQSGNRKAHMIKIHNIPLPRRQRSKNELDQEIIIVNG